MKRVAPKKGLRKGNFYDACWRAPIVLLWNCDSAELQRFIRARYDSDYEREGDFGGRFIKAHDQKADEETYIIALRHWAKTSDWIAVLTHEALHCTNTILWRRGLTCTPESEEAFCYLHESIVSRCLHILDGKRSE